MKTIAKNRLHKFIPRIRNIKSFTLENGFRGETVADENVKRYLDFAVKTDAKFRYNPETLKGSAKHHSNHWFDFELAPE